MDHTTTAIDSALLTEMTIALLDGAFETPPWRSFLDQLRRATDADFATLVFHPPGCPYNDGLHLISGEATPADTHAISRRHRLVDKPVRREATEEGRPYSLAEILRLDAGANQSFFDELIEVHGITAVRDMRVQEASGVDAWLAIARKCPDRPPA